MTSQTSVSKHRSDEVQGGLCQSMSRDCLYAEARSESGDLTPRSHTTEQESTSTGPEQHGQERKKKRKNSFDELHSRAKRARRSAAVPTPLTVSALQKIQYEQLIGTKDSQAS